MKPKAPLFQFLDSINYTKEDLFEELGEKNYSPFSINRFLSGTIDTVFYASEMNIRHHLPKEMQYEYLKNSVRKRKRYSQWFKKEEQENIDVIMEVYKYNYDKAKEVSTILSQEEIDVLKQKISKGGVQK